MPHPTLTGRQRMFHNLREAARAFGNKGSHHVSAPPFPYHLLAKPTGATCNLDCKYCYFLSKDGLYPNERMRMADDVLETYIRQRLDSLDDPELNIAWQGGEPTLMGLDFFRRSVSYVAKHRRPGQSVLHTIQTNGLLLDDEWCAFFKEHNFLVGLSVDGRRRCTTRTVSTSAAAARSIG